MSVKNLHDWSEFNLKQVWQVQAQHSLVTSSSLRAAPQLHHSQRWGKLFSRWNWNWIMLPQMLTGDLDSSLANLASNLDFGNGAKKWGNCFLIHFGGKIASERNQPKSTEWICKNTFFLGTYYRVGRVVPQWPRCIENFLLSVTIIPVFGLISGVCIVCIFLIHPWLSRSLSHCCRFRVLPPSLVNKHSLLWWDFTEWSKCWQSPFPFTAFLKKAFTK